MRRIVEASAIPWGGRQLPYTIRRDAQRTIVKFKALPGGGVELRAPIHLDTDTLDALAAQNAAWIAQRVEGVGCPFTATAPRAFVTGESVFYLGRHYRLKVLPGEGGNVKLRGGWLQIPVRESKHQAAEVRAALVAWFRRQAEQRLPERVEEWRAAVGVPMPIVVIANQRTRLGNCDRTGTIRLNWRLVQVCVRLIDYVVVRHLMLLRHRREGRAYWQAFEQVMSDCHTRRRILSQDGAGLFW